jgi:uncharacterized membrane protein YfcA
MKRRIAAIIGGAAATAGIPFGMGWYNWRILLGAAVAGAIGGLFGINVAKRVREYLPKRKVGP